MEGKELAFVEELISWGSCGIFFQRSCGHLELKLFWEWRGAYRLGEEDGARAYFHVNVLIIIIFVI